jgi:hypothetical protein
MPSRRANFKNSGDVNLVNSIPRNAARKISPIAMFLLSQRNQSKIDGEKVNRMLDNNSNN